MTQFLVEYGHPDNRKMDFALRGTKSISSVVAIETGSGWMLSCYHPLVYPILIAVATKNVRQIKNSQRLTASQ